MQDDPILAVRQKANLLQPNHAFQVGDMVIARSTAGPPRLAVGLIGINLTWRRGDFGAVLRDEMTARLDWRRCGYAATDFRQDALAVCARRPFEVRGVGRSDMRAVASLEAV